jgi:hypothetical protein
MRGAQLAIASPEIPHSGICKCTEHGGATHMSFDSLCPHRCGQQFRYLLRLIVFKSANMSSSYLSIHAPHQ